MSLTEGRRVYAIGDIHGCKDEMRRHHDRIADDLARNPHASPILVHVGDYVDRGPDSAGVIETLVRGDVPVRDCVNLLGNHDQMFVSFLHNLNKGAERFPWQAEVMGGLATLASYGLGPCETQAELAHARRTVPVLHQRFLRLLPRMRRIGAYVFVHAGIRPGVALEAQDPVDLIWIRNEFLESTEDHGAIIVHGHTPVDTPQHHGNRIEIDTGFVYGRTLTTLVLEDDGVWTLTPEGRKPLKQTRSLFRRLIGS